MTERFLDLAGLSDAPRLWNEIINASPDAGVWSTYSTYLFRLAYIQARGCLVADRSFVLLNDGQPFGLAPVVLVRDGQVDEVAASFQDVPLPWPMLVAGLDDSSATERSLFDEVERRCREGGAGRLSLMLAPPNVGSEYAEKFFRVTRERGFIDTNYKSHYVDISQHTLDTVRERYRRYVRKFKSKFNLQIIGAADVTMSLAAEYMDLHVKDAGGVFRPLVTYERQVDQVRSGEAFFVCARERLEDKLAGMLLIQIFKNAAYDASVAIDPRFENEGVSYLLKWHAIEHLIKIGVRHYELGSAALAPSFLWQPSAKNYGISFFKDGWSRGRLKTVWSAEKFYTSASIDIFLERKRGELMRYFALDEPL